MDENRDKHAVIANAIKSLEQAARVHGIEDSVIEEIIDIIQTISLNEDRLDASDLVRKEKKAVRAELQKSIDENLEALKKIRSIYI